MMSGSIGSRGVSVLPAESLLRSVRSCRVSCMIVIDPFRRERPVSLSSGWAFASGDTSVALSALI